MSCTHNHWSLFMLSTKNKKGVLWIIQQNKYFHIKVFYYCSIGNLPNSLHLFLCRMQGTNRTYFRHSFESNFTVFLQVSRVNQSCYVRFQISQEQCGDRCVCPTAIVCAYGMWTSIKNWRSFCLSDMIFIKKNTCRPPVEKSMTSWN